MSGDVPVKKVRIAVIAEAAATAPLDPGDYQVTIKSNTDSWFDMYPESVTMTEEPVMNDGELTVSQALDVLTREIAAAPQLTRGALTVCQLCRNHLLYLLDRPGPRASFTRMVQVRLHATVEVHRGHDHLRHPDANPPQIRGLTEPAGNSDRSESEEKGRTS